MFAMRSLLIGLLALPLPAAIQAQTEKPGAEVAPSAGQIQQPAALTPEQRGDIFMARKMYREAIEQYQEAPQTAAVLNKTGIAYHQLLQIDTAKKFYQRSIRLKPDYPDVVNNLGTVYYEKKSYRKAISQYRKALKLDPDSASIYSNLGTAYFARKQYKEAAGAYDQAIKLDPEIFEHRGGFGASMVQDQKVDERAKFHYFLAKTFAQRGMNEKALLYIRRSLEEGFKERKKYLEEPEFAAIRKMKEFKELMAAEPRVL